MKVERLAVAGRQQKIKTPATEQGSSMSLSQFLAKKDLDRLEQASSARVAPDRRPDPRPIATF